MTDESQDRQDPLSEAEIRQLFQQFEPVEVPHATRELVRTKLLDEVANTISSPSFQGEVSKFSLRSVWRKVARKLPEFQLIPSLITATAGVAAVLLLIYVYPLIVNPPSAKVVVLNTVNSRSSDIAVLEQNRRRQLIELSIGEEGTIEEGDRFFTHSSTVLVEYANGWKSIVQPGSLIEVEELDIRRDQVDIGLHLVDGEILTEIDRELGYQGVLAVRTQSASATAVGTKFIVRANSSSSSYVAVLSGDVEVTTSFGEKFSGTSNEQYLVDALNGNVKQMDDQQLSSGISFAPGPYVTAADTSNDIWLYAAPRADASMIRQFTESRMSLIGADAGEQWYVVCCVSDNVLTWVRANQVHLHNLDGPIRRFSEDFIIQNEIDGADGGIPSELPLPQQQDRAAESGDPAVITLDQGELSEVAPTNATTAPTLDVERLAPTSTPIVTYQPAPTALATQKSLPAPSNWGPDFSPDIQIVDVTSGDEALQAVRVETPIGQSSTDSTDGLDRGSSDGGAPVASTDIALDSNGDPPLGSEAPDPNLQPPLVNATNEATAVLPTNSPIPPTSTPAPTERPTNTRRPNTSTNTPLPINGTQVATPIPTEVQPTPAAPTSTPLPNTATNTPAPTDIPVPPNTDTPTPPPTEVPAPATPTLVIVEPTVTPPPEPTSTEAPPKPEIIEPTQPAAPDTTPLATTEPPAGEATMPPTTEPTPTQSNPTPANTPTLQIIAPTNTPVATVTNTPNVKLTPDSEGAEPTPDSTNTPENTSPTATATAQIVEPTITSSPSQDEETIQGENENNQQSGEKDNESDKKDSQSSSGPTSGE